MARYIPSLAARPVPRYTSYPTATEFHDGVGAAEQAEALDTLVAGQSVSLYVHIPYCHHICWYCGCNTGAVTRPDRLTTYVDGLIAEIEAVGRRMAAGVTGVHFGGGSPNALAADDFRRVVGTLRASFRIAADAEIAVELDPRGLDADYCAMLGEVGVARASLGVQTFSDDVQRRINRVQPYWTVAEAVRDLRYAGVRHINFDLMYGLPGQSEGDIADTIDAALALHPDRLAVFGYAHVPQMMARQQMIDARDLPDGAARFGQSVLAAELLEAAGYQAIGFDHFALPGDTLAGTARAGRLHRNFQGFTDDAADVVIGLGASAISQFAGLLVQNDKNAGRYLERVTAGELAGVRGVKRSAEDRLRGALIERLLCDGEVDIAAIALEHEVPRHHVDGALIALDGMVGLGLVEIDGWRVRITPDGRPYARLAAAAFDRFRSAACSFGEAQTLVQAAPPIPAAPSI